MVDTERHRREKRIYVMLEKRARKAKTNHLDFMRHTWRHGNSPFLVGQHTVLICNIIDDALAKYKEGISSFIDIACPFRHGKSTIISEDLPPRFLGEFPSAEVMLISYGDDLSTKFSKISRKKIQSPEYRQIYKNVELDRFNKSVHEWGIDENNGLAQYSGVSGGLSGKGYNLGICDDLFKNREQADSPTYREKIWESYTNDFLSRRAPVSITINLNTRWHEDDHNGRIKAKMKLDPEFPKFQTYTIPAISDKYETGYLFPERFTPKWYREQKASLGDYGFNSLMQGDPTPREGNQFKGKGIQIIEESQLPSDLRWVRAWDLASTDKQTSKSDPDYTSGPLMAVESESHLINGESVLKHKIYIREHVYGQWDAPERNRKIINSSIRDGSGVPVVVEGFGAYKDSYLIIKDVLKGIRNVHKLNLPGNKVAKASPLEPIYEDGNIFLVRGSWNAPIIAEFKKFPGGSHDDIVDSIVVGYNKALKVFDVSPFDIPI